MIRDPSAAEIVAAVKEWLEQQAAHPSDRDKYFARVAENALAIVRREETLAATLATDEANAMLCKDLRQGVLNEHTPDLIARLKEAILKQIAIDQPNYRSLPPPR